MMDDEISGLSLKQQIQYENVAEIIEKCQRCLQVARMSSTYRTPLNPTLSRLLRGGAE